MLSLRKLSAVVAIVLMVPLGQNPNAVFAQVARTFSYQGELLDGNALASGFHAITANYYDASGTLLYSETFTNVAVKQGVFSLTLGSASPGFPLTMSFKERYFLGIDIDGKGELSPRTVLTSVPYSLNADKVNGIEASITPEAGKLVPLDATGHFDRQVIPPTSSGISTINTVPPDANGNFTLEGAGTVAVGNDLVNHKVTLTGTGITGVIAGQGLIGGGNSGTVVLSIAPGSIDATMLAAGVVGGRKIDPFMAGLGLYQDLLGNLNVGVDNSTIEIYRKIVRVKPLGIGTDQLADGAVTAAKVNAGQVQLRVFGAAQPGTYMQSVNQDGSVNTGTVQINPTLTRNVTGTDLTLGIALPHPNQWTGLQSFNAGATASTLAVNNANPAGSNTFAATITTSGERGLRVQCTTETGSSLSSNTHFIDFYDGTSSNWRGSIQGQSYSEYWNDPINIALAVTNGVQIVSGAVATGSAIASAASLFAAAAAAGIGASAASFIAQAVQYGTVTGLQSGVNLGVAYSSSSGDYAEYLRRADPSEALYPGDVVGMTNGLISKNTVCAQNILSISMAPIVLGNTPPKGQEQAYNKVAFLGQVPVKVRGVVNEGDFIIASGLNDGVGLAVSAQNITPEQFTQVLGRAWTTSTDAKLKYIKVAVGLNAKSMSEVMSRQQNEINQLKQKLNGEVSTMNAKLDRLEKAFHQGADQNTHEVKFTNN